MSHVVRQLAWIALIAWPVAAHAQVPIMDGHRFVPSSLVTWSFVDTEVSSTSEAGVTDFVIRPTLPQLSSVQLPRSLDGSFITAAQSVAASVAFDEIFSLNARLAAGGILPLDVVSSLVVGGQGACDEDFGGALRLLRTDAFQLTLRADFTASEIESVIPAQLPSSPRVTGHIIGVVPALAAALTLSPRFGLQGSLAVEWQDYEVETTNNITSLSGAVAGTFSLDPAPLTALVGANVAHEFGRDVFTPTSAAIFGPDRTAWNLEAGLYFTARRELDLGLLFRAELESGDHNDRLHGLFRLGYYF